MDILNKGKLIEFINKTNVVLILKIGSPISLKDFRPINLYSVLYKIIAKTAVNSLQKMLDSCIDEAQSAFLYLGDLLRIIFS